MAWQPFETAPKDGTVIDLWIPHLNSQRETDCRFTNAVWSSGEWVDFWSGDLISDLFIDKPTHWMPIPEGPK